MLQYALSDEWFTLGTQQIVLAVLRQQHNRPILHLELAVILSAAHFDVETFRRLQVLSKIQTSRPYGPHIRSQGAAVAGEPLDLLLAQAQLEVRREDAAGLPPVVSDARHAMVDVSQKTPLVALQTSMSQLDTCKMNNVRLVRVFRDFTDLTIIPSPRLW